ncbi:hypothetical protein SKAU_G00058720 [Synaphobranchus kaupii]|uniref:Uncharacterized protein n=1 Tax=Synaphobranchus kaupii TaxID=118154 RepID=A0A9Q1G4G3_SYNKA|nr:hypothetical protein SKAU_G00058720 [Synaphobranchus kaupii]
MDSADSSQLRTVLDRQGVLLGRHRSRLDSAGGGLRGTCGERHHPVPSLLGGSGSVGHRDGGPLGSAGRSCSEYLS